MTMYMMYELFKKVKLESQKKKINWNTVIWIYYLRETTSGKVQ